MNTLTQKSPLFNAIAIILLAIFLFDVMGAIIKHLGTRYPAQQLSMLRNVFGLIPVFWCCSIRLAGMKRADQCGLCNGSLRSLAGAL